MNPLPVGQSDSGDFSSWLGRPWQNQEETFIMVQAGVAIASGSNGKQLVTALSSGVASWVVSLATGIGDHLCCGAIPWTHTAAIASGAYFPALRSSSQHVLLIRGALTGSMAVGSDLTTGSGADLLNILTGADPVTGLTSTASGVALVVKQFSTSPGRSLTADTGIAAVSGVVRYLAPFRE
jgi:hypothetical protein